MINSNNRYRLRSLLALGLGAIALILLAASMSNLDLQTGGILMEPIEGALVPPDEDEDVPNAPVFVEPTNLTTILVLGSLTLIIIFAAVRWKQIRIALLVLVLFSASVIGMIYLYTIYGEPPTQTGDDEISPPVIQQRLLDEDLLNNTPDWIDPISIIIAVTLGAIAVAAVLFIIRRRWQKDLGALELIAADAEAALEEIFAGGNLRDVILRCYIEMSQGLQRSIGLARKEGMTPREFEITLIKSGLPYDSVHRLTRLFESVRYGRHEATEGEIREAIDCLEEIISVATSHQDEVSQESLQTQNA